MSQGLDALPSLPRFGETLANPLSALHDAAREKGDTILVRSGSGLFSRSASCPGVVFAFGADKLRTVLSSPVFAIPRSAAHAVALPHRWSISTAACKACLATSTTPSGGSLQARSAS